MKATSQKRIHLTMKYMIALTLVPVCYYHAKLCKKSVIFYTGSRGLRLFLNIGKCSVQCHCASQSLLKAWTLY